MSEYPGWFDPAIYAGQKIQQLNEIQYLGRSNWDQASYEAELQNFRTEAGQPLHGETLEDKAYTNFLACNGMNYDPAVGWTAINVSASPYFDIGVYLKNVVDHANRLEIPGAPTTGWTIDSMLQHIFYDLRMSAWEHYTTVGMFSDIDPSNAFSTRGYLEARVRAMNEFENSDGSLGWSGRNDWTLASVKELLQQADKNPVMDLAEAGGSVFALEAIAPASPTEIPEGWTPWAASIPHNPYDDVKVTVEMDAATHAYTSEPGVNTRFEAIWNNATEQSTIAETDTIHAGAGAYNTLAFTLDAPWAGFRGQGGPNVTNIGRVELMHGAASPATPYLFDARNMANVERIDINDNNGAGAISVKNLAASVKQIIINNLTPTETGITLPTSIEYADGAAKGNSDSLEIGVANVGADNAAAPINMADIENLAIRALTGANYVNLQGALGLKNLVVAGGGNLNITNVPEGIASYDASQATGRVNMAVSDITPATVVRGGMGMDTVTLTRDFTGAPAGWTGVEQLGISPGVTAAVDASHVRGLSSLMLNSALDVSITNLPATSVFTIFELAKGSSGNVTLNGAIQTLNVSTGAYASDEGATTSPKITSNVAANVNIHSTGQGNLAGKHTFNNAAGAVNLVVEEGATFSGEINAVKAASFKVNAEGMLQNGAKLHVVDTSGGNGSVAINAKNGVADIKTGGDTEAAKSGSIVLDADGAATVAIVSGGNFALANGSSLKAAQNVTIDLSEGESAFKAGATDLPSLASLSTKGGSLEFDDLGSADRHGLIEIKVEDAALFSAKNIQTGSNGNIVANIKAETAAISNVAAGGSGTSGGDVHLTFEGASAAAANQSAMTVKGADIFIDVSKVTGAAAPGAGTGGDADTGEGDAAPEPAEPLACRMALSAAETINFVGSAAADKITVAKIGSGVSNINLGDGGDSLYINSGALSAGARADISIDLGKDTVEDIVGIGQQTGARLAVNIDNFVEGTDIISGFNAASLTASQAQSLLASFGITGINVQSNMMRDFGSGDGIFINGDLYGFNSSGNATCMVVLNGVQKVTNLAGAPITEESPADDGEVPTA